MRSSGWPASTDRKLAICAKIRHCEVESPASSGIDACGLVPRSRVSVSHRVTTRRSTHSAGVSRKSQSQASASAADAVVPSPEIVSSGEPMSAMNATQIASVV